MSAVVPSVLPATDKIAVACDRASVLPLAATAKPVGAWLARSGTAATSPVAAGAHHPSSAAAVADNAGQKQYLLLALANVDRGSVHNNWWPVAATTLRPTTHPARNDEHPATDCGEYRCAATICSETHCSADRRAWQPRRQPGQASPGEQLRPAHTSEESLVLAVPPSAAGACQTAGNWPTPETA